MNVINEATPLLPSGQTYQNQTMTPHPALDDSVLAQIRSLLVNAGVTTSMMDLPGEDFSEGPVAPEAEAEASKASICDDADAGEGAGSQSTWLTATMSAMAAERMQEVHDTTKEYNLPEGVYMMLFMSHNWTLPFWYAVANICQKFTLFGIVAYWIYRPGGFRDEQLALGPTPPIVQATQFLLIPVAVGITEELLITFDVLGKVGWKKLDAHPQATRLKYAIANILRALDGIIWLFIIASLMFYAVDVLDMFLNFAALQFLQSVDNAAYDMAKGGYLIESLEIVALDVAKTTMPSIRNTWWEYADTIFLYLIQLLLVVWWALLNFA